MKWVQSTHPGGRIVLVTGYPEELGEPVERGEGVVVDAVCLKPLDVPRFLATLERATGGGAGPRRAWWLARQGLLLALSTGGRGSRPTCPLWITAGAGPTYGEART